METASINSIFKTFCYKRKMGNRVEAGGECEFKHSPLPVGDGRG